MIYTILTTIIDELIAKIGSDKLVAVAMDNASDLGGSWTAVEKAYPTLLFIEGGIRLMDSFVHNFVTSTAFSSTLKKVKFILRHFRTQKDSAVLLQSYQETNNGSVRPLPNPDNTHIQGYIDMITAISENRDALLSSAIMSGNAFQPPGNENSTIEILNDDNFWTSLSYLAELLRFFADKAAILHGGKPFLPRLYSTKGALNDKSYSGVDVNVNIQKCIRKRFVLISEPVMTIAYILDPSARAEANIDLEGANWDLVCFPFLP
jgi:hypothetical protein